LEWFKLHQLLLAYRVKIGKRSVHNSVWLFSGQFIFLANRGYSVNNNHQKRSPGHRYFSLTTMALLLVGLLSACSSGLKVRSDIDPAANFAQYTTYNFFEPMGIESGYNSPIFGEHFRGAIGGELSRRGYRTADKPNLLINVTIRSDDKVRMRSYTAPYVSGGYYGRPGGAYGGSALGVGVSTGSRATMTTEASVFIDFVDLQDQRVVWQGVAVINVNDKVATQLRDAIYTSVNKVLAQYPHTAGK
jgi:hypothetical protein